MFLKLMTDYLFDSVAVMQFSQLVFTLHLWSLSKTATDNIKSNEIGRTAKTYFKAVKTLSD